MPVAGAFEVMVGGETVNVAAGQVLVLPADEVRQVRTREAAAEALVCMPIGGKAYLPDSTDHRVDLPWAE